MVGKFNNLQIRIVDYNSQVFSPDKMTNLGFAQMKFNDLVYMLKCIYLQLTKSSTITSEFPDVKSNLNVPHPKIFILKFSNQIYQWPEFH